EFVDDNTNARFFLQARGEPCHVFMADDLAVLVRGYALPAGADGPPDAALVAEAVARHYRRHGDLPTDKLEGSFTLALLDGRARRLLLYRNLIGVGFTYYREAAGRFFFGSNLADLVASVGGRAVPNGAA